MTDTEPGSAYYTEAHDSTKVDVDQSDEIWSRRPFGEVQEERTHRGLSTTSTYKVNWDRLMDWLDVPENRQSLRAATDMSAIEIGAAFPIQDMPTHWWPVFLKDGTLAQFQKLRTKRTGDASRCYSSFTLALYGGSSRAKILDTMLGGDTKANRVTLSRWWKTLTEDEQVQYEASYLKGATKGELAAIKGSAKRKARKANKNEMGASSSALTTTQFPDNATDYAQS